MIGICFGFFFSSEKGLFYVKVCSRCHRDDTGSESHLRYYYILKGQLIGYRNITVVKMSKYLITTDHFRLVS